jgi:hypothetical protein
MCGGLCATGGFGAWSSVAGERNTVAGASLHAVAAGAGRRSCRLECAARQVIAEPILQAAIAAALRLNIQKKTLTKSVLVLKAMPVASILTPTASTVSYGDGSQGTRLTAVREFVPRRSQNTAQ